MPVKRLYGAVYEVRFPTIGRILIDWSDPEHVRLYGYDHGQIKLLKESRLHFEEPAIALAVKTAAGTHFAGLYCDRAYHSPSITVYIVPTPDKSGKKGWGFKISDWDVTRGKKKS